MISSGLASVRICDGAENDKSFGCCTSNIISVGTMLSLINTYGLPLRGRFELRATDDAAIARIILPPLTRVEAGHQGIGIELGERKVDHNVTDTVYVSDYQGMNGGVDVLTAQFAEAWILDVHEVSFSIQEEERTRERYKVRSKIANTEVSRPVWTVTGSI